MRRFFPFFLLVVAGGLHAEQHSDTPDAPRLSPEQEQRTFRVPPGFEIQLVAAEPEITKPLNLCFDAAGRLWVTCTETYPWAARRDALGQAIPGFDQAWKETAAYFRIPQTGAAAPSAPERGRDTVRILSDFAPDGRARKVQIFADGLNIPIGLQPLPRSPASRGDSLIVHSIPAIWRLSDTDGDGTSDHREQLYSSFGYKDTHGMSSNYIYWVDGWIYGCHGYANRSEVTDRTGRTTILESGNTYRFRPDGSRFEVYSHGQTNPFGLAVDPLGDFYTCDSHSRPAMLVLPGGYYEGINKQHDGLGFAPRIMEHDHGSSSIAGIAWYGASQFPPEYRGNTFNGNPVTRRINRDRYEWDGSSPRAVEMPDLLTSDDPCFRPVQVVLGPDGALYVADFYNPIIGHYEFPLVDHRRDRQSGRIWRIVWRGASASYCMPDLGGADTAKLLAQLSGDNLLLSRLAVNELTDRVGPSAVDDVGAFYRDLKQPVAARALAAFVLQRWGQDVPLDADEPNALELRRLGEKPTCNEAERSAIRRGFGSRDPRIQRAAVQAAACHPQGLMRDLVSLDRRTKDDPQLTYAIRLALRSALSEPDGFAAAAPLLAEAATAAPIAHTAMALPNPSAARALLDLIIRSRLKTERAVDLVRHTVRYLAPEDFPKLEGTLEALASLATAEAVPFAVSFATAQALRPADAKANFPQPLETWIHGILLTALSPEEQPATTTAALAALREIAGDWKIEAIRTVLRDPSQPARLRVAALEALGGTSALFEDCRSILTSSTETSLRLKAASLLGQRHNDPVVQSALLEALPTAPLDVATEIATALAQSDAGASLLFEAIESHRTPARLLRQRAVARAIGRCSAPLVARSEALTRELPPEDARLDTVIAERTRAYVSAHHSPERGAEIFSRTCSACHRIHGQGGLVGPTLDGIRSRGVARLIEDILDPNRNVDPLFHQALLETHDGRSIAGLGLREVGDRFQFTDASGQTTSIAKSEVKSQTWITSSLMPSSFENLLPLADFFDLIAYLLQD